MLHPIIMYELARARQTDILKEAEANRIARQARAVQPRPHERSILSIRSLLTSVGLALGRQRGARRASYPLSREQLTAYCDDQVCA